MSEVINNRIFGDPIDGDWNHFDHSCVYLDHEGELISFEVPEFKSSGNLMNENTYSILKSNNDEFSIKK